MHTSAKHQLEEILEKPTIMFDYNNRRIEVTVPETIRGEVYKMGQTATKFRPRYQSSQMYPELTA